MTFDDYLYVVDQFCDDHNTQLFIIPGGKVLWKDTTAVPSSTAKWQCCVSDPREGPSAMTNRRFKIRKIIYYPLTDKTFLVPSRINYKYQFLDDGYYFPSYGWFKSSSTHCWPRISSKEKVQAIIHQAGPKQVGDFTCFQRFVILLRYADFIAIFFLGIGT